MYNVCMKIGKGMTNVDIAELLRVVAACYEIKKGDKAKFKIIAYNKAADAVEHLSSEAKDLWDDGKLEVVAGIGPSIAEHLGEIFQTGTSRHFEELMQGIAPAVFEMMKVTGIGPKTAFRFSTALNIKKEKDALQRLKEAAEAGEIEKLEGFGEDSQQSILEALKEVKTEDKRMLLPYAMSRADDVITWMRQSKATKKADALGSLRRKAATVGDIDVAVGSSNPIETIDHFTKYPDAQRVLDKGEHSASILAPGNIRVDIKVIDVGSYGSLLQHFTGSKHHNIALREYALGLNPRLSLSEYGIKEVGSKKSVLRKFQDEESFYQHLGLNWIPPEIREDTGEIQAALYSAQCKLPNLVKLEEVRGDLQIHSSFDIETSHDLGASTMEEIIEKADELGYEYVAFTEHNPSSSKHSDTQITDILKRKQEKIEQINTTLVKRMKRSVKRVFNCLEIDILPDGRLPVPEKGLNTLDFALVSIHSAFRQPRQDITRRVVKAFDNPKVKIFAHPTGRKLNEREGADLDWDEVFEACKKQNIWLEINADPMRLDLPDMLVRDAVKLGIPLTFGTDAHHIDGMDNMQWAVYVARRGWATKNNIVNTRSLEDFEKVLELS